MQSILIVGLGNPGEKYEYNRHNIGQRIVQEYGEKFGQGKFKINPKLSASLKTIDQPIQKVFLAMPTTFMNDSGEAVKKMKNFFKIKTENIIIVRDDIDLEFGKIKIKKDSSSGGHHGIDSIIENLKTKNFTQIKIGIKSEYKIPKEKIPDFVTSDFNRKEKKELTQTIESVVKMFDLIAH